MILVPLSWFLFNINNAPLIFTFTMMIYPSWYSSPDFTSVKFTLKINIVLILVLILSRLLIVFIYPHDCDRCCSGWFDEYQTSVGTAGPQWGEHYLLRDVLERHLHSYGIIIITMKHGYPLGEIKSISPILLFLKPKNWNYFRLEHDL